MHDAQTPLLAIPALSRALSTTAHAKQDGQCGSLLLLVALPCVVIVNVWSSIALSSSAPYVIWNVDVLVTAV